jgi:integrase
MKIELNDRYLRGLMKPDMEHMEVSDTKRAGLRIRVYPRTSKFKERRIVFMYEKRVKGGPKRKHTFGAWPQLSLAEARQMALEIELEANKGIDRVELKRQQQLIEETAKAGLTTVQEVIATYDKLHLSSIKTRDERNRQLNQSLEKHLNKSIKDLTRKDLQEAVDAKANTGRKPYANRIRAALVAFAKWAWVRGYIDSDIGAGIAKATREAARDRVLSITEVQTIWNATYEMGELWGPLLRLVILTGQRRSEIAELQWNEIDLVKAQMVKSGMQTKNGKPHTTHLAAPALRELQELSQSKNDNKWVFSTTGKTPVSGLSKVKSRLDKILGDDFEPWRIHDIRTGLASALAETGEPENVVDRILNHSASGSAPSAVARVYNQADMLPQRARALDKWADIVTGKRSNVVRLHG